MILTVSKAALLGAMIFQARNDARYYFNGICFAPDKKIYSTDGHRAFIGEHLTDDLTESVIISLGGPKFTRFDRAEIDTEAGIVFYLSESGIRVGVGLCDVVDGRYPDIEKLLENFKNRETNEIGFNAGYLADIEKAAKLYDHKFCGIRIKTNGNTNASVVEFFGACGEGKVVIMPMRI